MCIEEFASVVHSISSTLEPYGEILLIQTLAHGFWVSSNSGYSQCEYSLHTQNKLSPYGGVHVCDIDIMGGSSCPEIDSRGAA